MTIELTPAQLHIWHANVGPQLPPASRLEPTLSYAERERARGFSFDTHRNRYIYAHACLRLLLAAYLRTSPREITLLTGTFGKPYVAAHNLPAAGGKSLEFNISHSADLAIFGFSLDAVVGVDIEFINTRINLDEVAPTVFTPSELASKHSLPPHAQFDYFFDLWTRKEAYSKALGTGLQIPFSRLQIGHEPVVNSLSIHSFTPVPGYAAACAIPEYVQAIHYFEFKSTFWECDICE